jgi:F-type H+-transporting ATPase subunit b
MHFDWSTLILQTVNVLVLLWLLRRFLFRPVMAIIAQRQATAEKLLADAAAAREQAQAQVAQTTQHQQALTADSDRILAATRAAAETERTNLLKQAEDEAAKMRDAARAALEQQRGQMRRELEVEAGHLAVTIASRLLGRVPAQAMNAALLGTLDALRPDEWRTLAAPGDVLEIVTAGALDAATRDACADKVRQNLGCTVRFEIDPSLIAGVEWRGPHARLHNSWRADLDRIAEELSRDGTHVAMA